MITEIKKREFIKSVASRLAGNFMKPLLQTTNLKSYPVYIAGLAEILDWPQEFYEECHEKINSWTFLSDASCNFSGENLPDELIMAFGREKIQKFIDQNFDGDKYFLEKYSVLIMEDEKETIFDEE